LADNPTPHWQPLTALPLIASLIDGELADGQEHHATLRSVRDRPYVLDDATVQRNLKLHTEQRDFLGVSPSNSPAGTTKGPRTRNAANWTGWRGNSNACARS
jgi:hypothetical protein